MSTTGYWSPTRSATGGKNSCSATNLAENTSLENRRGGLTLSQEKELYCALQHGKCCNGDTDQAAQRHPEGEALPRTARERAGAARAHGQGRRHVFHLALKPTVACRKQEPRPVAKLGRLPVSQFLVSCRPMSSKTDDRNTTDVSQRVAATIVGAVILLTILGLAYLGIR